MVLLLGVLAVLLLAPAAVVLQVHFGYSAVIYAGLAVLLLGVTLVRCGWLMTRSPRRERIALDIEETCPDLGSNLISSLQLFPRKGELGDDDPTSPALIDALVNDTSRDVEPLDPEDYVSYAGFRRLGRLAGALAVVVLLMAFVWPGLFPRAGYLLANAVDLMPSRITHLEMWAERTTVLPGMPVTFEVKTRGRETDSVGLEVGQGAESDASIPMEKVGPHHFRARWLAAGARCPHHGAHRQVPLPHDCGSRRGAAQGGIHRGRPVSAGVYEAQNPPRPKAAATFAPIWVLKFTCPSRRTNRWKRRSFHWPMGGDCRSTPRRRVVRSAGR